MVTLRKPKVKKYRGSKTHGGGSMKKRRGAGSRGGRGNAGTGKRGNAKAPTMWKTGRKLGKFGFKKKGSVVGRVSISLHLVEELIPRFEAAGHAKKSKDGYAVDLTAAGYDKLLANGNVNQKLEITVKMASAAATEKITAAGGKVVESGATEEAAPAKAAPAKEAKKE